jgi:hypothetical protein
MESVTISKEDQSKMKKIKEKERRIYKC